MLIVLVIIISRNKAVQGLKPGTEQMAGRIQSSLRSGPAGHTAQAVKGEQMWLKCKGPMQLGAVRAGPAALKQLGRKGSQC